MTDPYCAQHPHQRLLACGACLVQAAPRCAHCWCSVVWVPLNALESRRHVQCCNCLTKRLEAA